MLAIFKREFKSYFSTPVGFIVLAAYYFFLGLYFEMVFSYGSPEVSYTILAMNNVVVFTTPIITMKLMSDDRRQKVDQALLTAPVRLTAIVGGKFLAAFALFALGFAPTLIFELIVASYVTVSFFSYLYALLGICLLGAALIAIGMFISSLTESPAVSAMLSLVVNILVLYMSGIASLFSGSSTSTEVGKFIMDALAKVAEKAAFISVVENFGNQVFSIVDIVYFLSIIAAFLFLSVRSLEKRRWA